ncbi:MAG: SHOCT domain-containing protein [Ruminococcaceae bacterium]|nr:SHOCT domain-containing protein [Oscillospiraceae bacterium]
MTHEELIEELKKLAMLHESGVLSKTEFDEMKQKLLDQAIGSSKIEQGNGSKAVTKPIENLNKGVFCGHKEGVSKKQPSLKIAGVIIGIIALVVMAFFLYFYIAHEATQKVSTDYDSIPAAVEAIEVKETSEPVEIADEKVNTDETFFYEGPYSIFGMDGRAKYSYKIDDALNSVLDGSFEFDEGFYEDDGSFNGMGSGVEHVSGQFKDNKQIGEWNIGSAHYSITIVFKDGIPNGKFLWSFRDGECKGTYKNGKLVGDFSYEGYDLGSEIYLKGVFNSQGKPTGVWEEKTGSGDRRWYIMDEAAAKETGVKGSFDGDYMYRENLDLKYKMLDMSKYVLSKKVSKQNLEYPTFWKD